MQFTRRLATSSSSSHPQFSACTIFQATNNRKTNLYVCVCVYCIVTKSSSKLINADVLQMTLVGLPCLCVEGKAVFQLKAPLIVLSIATSSFC